MKKKLIAKYHILTKGMNDDEKLALLSGYNVESSKDLNEKQLIDLINKLEGKQTDPEGDMWRKRVIAAIGAYLRRTNQTETIEYIKSIACRAAETDSFNKIANTKLRAIYSEFTKKEQVGNNITDLKKEFWEYQKSRN